MGKKCINNAGIDFLPKDGVIYVGPFGLRWIDENSKGVERERAKLKRVRGFYDVFKKRAASK